ncbi:MAG: VWA domain-containing protein [Planctomycetes bacterium]|nr:VWA domain-containing protein [Planctomycetota bacterium]
MHAIIAQFELAAPQRLIALAIVAVVLLAGWFSVSRHSGGRRCAMTLCRALAVAALVLAWAGLAWRGPTTRTFVVWADDRSDSVSNSSRADATPLPCNALLSFAGQTSSAAEALATTKQAVAADQENSQKIAPLASDPALAVLRAAALVPDAYVGHVVLESDGRATRDGLVAVAKAQGMPVHTVVKPSFPEPEVCIAEVKAPQSIRPLTQFDVDVVITSNQDDTCRLEFQSGEGPPEKREVRIVFGTNHFSFTSMLDNTQPSLRLKAVLTGCQDTYAANNTRRAMVIAAAKPRVMLVADAASAANALQAALEPLGFEVISTPATRLPANIEALARYDAILFSDIAPQSVPRLQQEAIEQFVRSGGGLLVCGSEKMLASRPLAGSWLEGLLPLTAAQAREQRKPTLALVLIIDRSKSMLDEGRLDMAKEAARRTVGLDVITPVDQVGVLAFGDESQWISPLAPSGNKQSLLAAIDTLQAEGATNMAPAMQRARLALLETIADRRHVILLSDGVSTPGDFDQIARAMAAAGITVSTVSVSQGADQTILRDIARTAGGRHYHCDDPRQVPRILEEETRSTAQPAAAASVRPLVYRALPDLNVATAPPLKGYVPTNPKPGAELILISPSGDPLLAWTRQGRGAVVAMAADMVGPQGAEWRSWKGFGPFLGRLVHHVLPVREPAYRIATERRFGQLCVTAEATSPAKTKPNPAGTLLTFRFQGDDGKYGPPTEKMMSEPAPGRYEATLDSTATGIYGLKIRSGDGIETHLEQRLAVTVDYPDELKLGPPDETLLKEVASVTGGSMLTDPRQGVPSDGRTVERLIRLWPTLVIAAILLLTVEIFIRRGKQAETMLRAPEGTPRWCDRPMGVP